MSFPTNNKASGRRTSGISLPFIPSNLGVRSVPFPNPNTSAKKQKTLENAYQNYTPKIPQLHSPGAATMQRVRFSGPASQFSPTDNVCHVDVNKGEKTLNTGLSSEQREILSAVVTDSKTPSSSLKNQDVSLFQSSAEPDLRKVNNSSEVDIRAMRMNASISSQGILSLLPDGANKTRDNSELIIKKVSLDKCSRLVLKSKSLKGVVSPKKDPKLMLETCQAILTNNKPLEKATQKKKVETVTREAVAKTEDIKEKVENLDKQEHGENLSKILVDPEEVEIVFEKVTKQVLVVKKEDIESNPLDQGNVVQPDVGRTEADIRNEGEVLQKLVERNREDLQKRIKVQPFYSFDPADKYRANQEFHENIFPKKWERLMRPLQHLVNSKVCKICIKEFGNIEVARAHYRTKSHVKNHLEQIEKESVSKDFLPSRWKQELLSESEIIEDRPGDASLPW